MGDRQMWVPSLPMVPGGNAANFALGCAALGLHTGLAACLGGDTISGFLRASLRNQGVASFIKVRKALEAGRTMSIAHSDGSRQLVTYNGSNLAFAPGDIPAKSLETRHLHRAGYWWTPRLQGKPTRDLLRTARNRGAETSLDVATDPTGWSESRRRLVLSTLPEVTVFFANEEEVAGIFGTKNLRRAGEEARALGVEVLAVHRGFRGCTIVFREGLARVPAFPVRVGNPTGTGDLFNAGFVYGRVQGWPVPRCARFANAVAALRLEGPSLYPSRRSVASFLSRKG